MCTTGDITHIDMIFKVLPDTCVKIGALCLHRHPLSVNCLYHTRMVVCRWVLCVLCTKCTLHRNHRFIRVIFQHTKDFSPGAAIFSLHTLASPSGRNMNYDEKQLTGKNFLSSSFYLYRFHKYVPYGFPKINFCNTGVHYEKPCICNHPAEYMMSQP